jgi:hypothetical protein
MRIDWKTTQSISSPTTSKGNTMKKSRFPEGWDEDRVRRVLAHYESQSDDEAVAEDEAAWEDSFQTFIEVPNDMVPAVRELLAKRAKNPKRGMTHQKPEQ